MAAAGIFFQGVVVPRRHPPHRRIWQAPRRPAPVAPESHGVFFERLAKIAGVPLDQYRTSALMRRLPACLRFLRSKTVEEALVRMEEQPELAHALLDVVLLGVTEFFRDRAVFDYLRTEVLPALRARRPGLRVWSAACSNGQELYSLAMLLAEDGWLDGAELVGTDCRVRAVNDACEGRFSPDTVCRLPVGWPARYFTPEGGAMRIHAGLRSAITWKTADLLAGVERGPWDLLLWRNMAIYLEPAAADEAWQRLAAELTPGGYLVTGKADHPGATVSLRRVAPCVYRKADHP